MCHKKNSYIFLYSNDCKTAYIDISIDLLSINFNLRSVLSHYAYHQINEFDIYIALTTIWWLNTLFFLTWLVLHQITLCIYVFRNPSWYQKKIIVLYQHIKAYSSAHCKVYSSDPRKCLCTQPEGMLKPIKTLALIQHHVERIL